MVDLAEIFGANRDYAKRELNESLHFEIELAKVKLQSSFQLNFFARANTNFFLQISLSTSERRDPLAMYNPTSIQDLQSNYNFISWHDYLNGLMAPYAEVSPSEVVNVQAPEYLKNLADLIRKTPKRVLANYAFWRVIKQSAEYLNDRVQVAKREFDEVISGTGKKNPRWMECVDEVDDKLYYATGSLYIRKHFNKKSKDDVLEIASEVKNSFRQMLTKVCDNFQ